jgi:hypothetical protein
MKKTLLFSTRLGLGSGGYYLKSVSTGHSSISKTHKHSEVELADIEEVYVDSTDNTDQIMESVLYV